MKCILFLLLLTQVCLGQISRVAFVSGNYNVALSDRNALIVFSNIRTSQVKMIIPFETTNFRTNFSSGTVIYGSALTDSTVLIQGASGVTIVNGEDAFRSKNYGSEWELKRLGRNLWVLSGDLYSLNQVAFVGDDVVIKAIVDPIATGPFNYKWFKNNALITGATNASLKLTNVKTTDSGSYRADVSNVSGTVKSETTNLQVR